MTRRVQTDMEANIIAALEATPGATLAQLSEAIPDETSERIAATLHYLARQANPPRIARTGETRWFRYWIPGTVPENPEPVPRDIRIGNLKGSPGHTAQLVQAVREAPGITAAELGRITEIVDGAKILAVLVRRGQMQAVGPRTRKRYYPFGYAIPPEAGTPDAPKLATTAKPKRTAEVKRPATRPQEAHEVKTSAASRFEAPATALEFSIDRAGRIRLQRYSEFFVLEPREVGALHEFVLGTQPVWKGAA